MVLRAGEVMRVDAPMDLYSHPLTPFVAGFIGSPSMAFLDVEVRGQVGEPVTLAFRPEEAHLSPA